MKYFSIHYEEDDAIIACVKASTEQQALERASDGLNTPIEDLEAFHLLHGYVSVIRLQHEYPGVVYFKAEE